MKSNFSDVVEFNKRFCIPTPGQVTLITTSDMQERVDFIYEELAELVDGFNKADVEEVADALIDIAYVVMGTAIRLGLPWEELWDDVHRANMAKQPGITKRNMKYDCIKPEGWVGPKTREILASHNLGKGDEIGEK